MEPSVNAHMTFGGHSFEDTAAYYIDAVEKAFNNEELSDWDTTLNDGLEDESHPE
jgi:hypothetical protein